jgi:DNA polymerase III psi subunit
MSLNDIQLNGPLLAEMYGKYLIDSGQEAPSSHLKKNMVIYRDESQNKAEQKKLLISIIAACNLSMEEVELIDWNQAGKEITLEESLQKAPEKLLLFGLFPGTGIEDRSGYFREFNLGGTKMLQAPTLSEIAEDRQLKMKLWGSLQSFFNLEKP